MNLNNIVNVSNWDELITNSIDYKLFRTAVTHDKEKEFYYESNLRRFVCGYKGAGYIGNLFGDVMICGRTCDVDVAEKNLIVNTWYSTNNNIHKLCIFHSTRYRVISIFNLLDRTTRYVIDNININNEHQQFSEYMELSLPVFNNKILDITFNNNGAIRQIDTMQGELQTVMSDILQYRINISNGVNIGLSNNTIVPLIFANSNIRDEHSNIRLINSQQFDNNDMFKAKSCDTYFTRLSQNVAINEQFQQLKNDFNLNNCTKDFALIPFECCGHISVVVADLRENDNMALLDRLYLFDTALEHANNVYNKEQHLTNYFGYLIKEKNVFYKEYKLQAIGNCAWLCSAFTEKCSQLNSFEEVLTQINNGQLLVDTINKTSLLMHERCIKNGNLITFNSNNNSIILHYNITQSASVNASSFMRTMEKKGVRVVDDDGETKIDYIWQHQNEYFRGLRNALPIEDVNGYNILSSNIEKYTKDETRIIPYQDLYKQPDEEAINAFTQKQKCVYDGLTDGQKKVYLNLYKLGAIPGNVSNSQPKQNTPKHTTNTNLYLQ